ncbi:hypothetical protein [Baekduia soli]|uniref:hypothetical protein n=1 Tax=Baekduia soli TaxID=496014 RepID=UPI0016525940|nr:hypothetical protein [Baekduia soli]
MRTAALVLCVIAIATWVPVIRDMVVGTGSSWRGWALRAIALLSFVLAVILNAAR